ncbi:homing endonuclease associated repeat-containing protein [Listeria booriae]|uniref:homing endonuclease associated repeat-containing protein n=1 Tax=Listeria booriae TaxID=1552123 RepID=UPI0016299229|nr:hypothetical protein [Listeria booriae]MBC2173856.1 hypothetical protein [Listeria booriae]MDT0112503.1 hypothetical protein [Listeria booriae]
MSKKIITDQFLIEEVIRTAKLLGRPPVGVTEYQYRNLATQRFGSWIKFLSEADLHWKADLGEGAEIRNMYIEEVRQIVHILNRVPRTSDFEDIREVRYYFKSLNGLLEAAGLEKKNNGYWSKKFING